MSDKQSSQHASRVRNMQDSLGDIVPLATLPTREHIVGIPRPGSNSSNKVRLSRTVMAGEDTGTDFRSPRKSNDNTRKEIPSLPFPNHALLGERQVSGDQSSFQESDSLLDHSDRLIPGPSTCDHQTQGTSEHKPGAVAPSHAAGCTTSAASQKNAKSNFGWLTWRLTLGWTAIVMTLQICIAVAITYLERRSAALQGFVDIPTAWSNSSGLFSHSAL